MLIAFNCSRHPVGEFYLSTSGRVALFTISLLAGLAAVWYYGQGAAMAKIITCGAIGGAAIIAVCISSVLDECLGDFAQSYELFSNNKKFKTFLDCELDIGTDPRTWLFRTNDPEVARILIDHFRCDPNDEDESGHTPIDYLSDYEDFADKPLYDLLRSRGALLRREIDPVNDPNDPIVKRISKQFLEMHQKNLDKHKENQKLISFLEQHSDLETHGNTLLHLAASSCLTANDCIEISRILIDDFGFNACDRNDQGQTPAEVADHRGNAVLHRFFLIESNAIQLTDIESVESFLGDKYQKYAAHREFLCFLKAQLEMGSDRRTWLFRADSVEVARILIDDFGYDVNYVNDSGETSYDVINRFAELTLPEKYHHTKVLCKGWQLRSFISGEKTLDEAGIRIVQGAYDPSHEYRRLRHFLLQRGARAANHPV